MQSKHTVIAFLSFKMQQILASTVRVKWQVTTLMTALNAVSTIFMA